MFTTHRKDWTELLCLMRLLTHSDVPMADTKGRPAGTSRRLLCVARLEEQGERYYRRTEQEVQISSSPHFSTETTRCFSTDVWDAAAEHAFLLLRTAGEGADIEVDDAMEAFLDEADFRSLSGTSEGRLQLRLHFEGYPEGAALLLSRAGAQTSLLLDGGRAANLKLEQTGTRFAAPMAAKVNALESEHTVADRMRMVERMGSLLKYHNVADRVFRANLAMIDLHLGRLLTELVRTSHLENVLRLDELTVMLREQNPLKVSAELIEKHGYYEHKVIQLLLACIAGLRPAKIYRGETSLPPYILLLMPDGCPVVFDTADRGLLATFLLHATRLDRGHLDRDRYGVLERENNVYYFKLNLKIALTKR